MCMCACACVHVRILTFVLWLKTGIEKKRGKKGCVNIAFTNRNMRGSLEIVFSQKSQDLKNVLYIFAKVPSIRSPEKLAYFSQDLKNVLLPYLEWPKDEMTSSGAVQSGSALTA